MKKFRFITMALIAMFMASCSNEEIATPEQEEEYVTVDLGVSGEYVDLSDSPLATRASTTADTYSVCVYTMEGSMEQGYAYGMFTSLQNVKIKLLKGKTYKFEVGIYVDDKVALGGPDPDNRTDYYSNNWTTYIKNKFTYGNAGNVNPGPGNYEHDFYYGELANYSPVENGTVEIYTKRTVYGAHFIAEGLTEGTLNIGVISTSSGACYNVELSDAAPEYNSIYRFGSIWSAWIGTYESADSPIPVNYYTTKQLTIKWEKADGSETPLGKFNVTFKRNVKTKIRIKVADPGIQNGIVITREDTPMSDDANEYVIEGGEITEVPVTTTPQ